MGQGTAGALCRRLRRHGATPEPAADHVGGKDVGGLAGVKDQSDQNAHREPERRGNASGFSGLPVPVRPRPLWPGQSLSAFVSVVESGEGGNTVTDGYYRQPTCLETVSPPS